MIQTNEENIKPPKFPLTIAINGAITDFYFNWFTSRFIPKGVSWVITSEYRTPAKNESVGGAANSAHIHNLAKDFILLKDGQKLNAADTSKIFDEIIKPNWQGYALNEADHIHVNISRRIGIAAGILSISVLGIIGINVYSNFKKGGKGDGKKTS